MEEFFIEKLKARVELVREASIKDMPKIRSAKDVARLFSYLKKFDREVFLCLHLDTKNRLLSYEEVSKGTMNSTLVHPREVLKGAILASAASILLVHNHPSTDPRPSKEDINITKTIKKAADIIGIELKDHIIIGRGYVSLRERRVI